MEDISKKRSKIIGVRYTETELEQIRMEMSTINCLSVSKFIRLKTLNQQIKIQKYAYTDRALYKQINKISEKISKIGNNYNQVVKKYHSSCTTFKKNGEPVINSKATIFYFRKLKELTEEIKKTQDELIEFVSRIEFGPDKSNNN